MHKTERGSEWRETEHRMGWELSMENRVSKLIETKTMDIEPNRTISMQTKKKTRKRINRIGPSFMRCVNFVIDQDLSLSLVPPQPFYR